MPIETDDLKQASTSGQGVQPESKKQEPQSGGAMATAKDSMQSKAAQGAAQLAQVEQKAQSASITTSFKTGQDDALIDTLAEQAGYLGTKAMLKAESTRQRIEGVKQTRRNAQVSLVSEVEALGQSEDDSDPLDLLSGYTGNSHALLLPSPFA